MEKYLRADQVSEILGVKKSTIHTWVYRKMIPYTKLANGTLRFSEKRLERWLEENSHE